MQASSHYIQQSCASSAHAAKYTLPTPHKPGKRALWRFIAPAALAASLLANVAFAGGSQARQATTLNNTGSPTASQYFGITGKVVSGNFLQTFNRFGLHSIGYPLTDERQENGMTVQYFERVRMEYHPESASRGYPVLISRLGDLLSKPVQPFARVAPFKSSKTSAYMKETGHSLSEPFLTFWKTTGGVDLYGYPLSEPMQQNGMLVQWFERARFEYHPDQAKAGKAVQLSLLGRDALAKAGALPATSAPPKPAAPPAQPQTQAPPSAPASDAPKQPAQVNLSGMESYLLKRINDLRAAAGLGQVQLSGPVTEIARSRSSDMAERNYFSHQTPEGATFLSMLTGRSISYKFAGEILARNNYPDDQAVEVAINSYLNSPPHKAIIIDGRYNQVGVGYSKSGEDAMHYFTVVFVQQ